MTRIGILKTCGEYGDWNRRTPLTTHCCRQRVATNTISAAATAVCSYLAKLSDIDPCKDGLRQSESAIFSGFSRMGVVQSANASLPLLMWIMSFCFLIKERLRYGTSKHYA